MSLVATIHGTKVQIGDTVAVHYKIIEKEVVSGKTKKEKHEEQKERTQAFIGMVIAMKGGGVNQSFTVRHIGVGNIGVERIFPVVSPWIKRVQVKKHGNVRRAKLYYLRAKTNKETAKISENADTVVEVAAPATPVAKPKAETAKDTSHAPQQPA